MSRAGQNICCLFLDTADSGLDTEVADHVPNISAFEPIVLSHLQCKI